jgi:ketosteroid isomerase-like protein
MMISALVPRAGAQLLDGIGAQTNAGTDRSSREKSSIKALIEQAAERWNAKDIDGLMETFWHSLDPIYVVGDEAFFGWDRTRQHFLNTYGERSSMGRVVNDQIEIRLVDANTAVAVISWTMRNVSGTAHGVSTSTLRKFPVGWRYVCCAVSIL